jgi:phosphotransferase system  glucose/maltose/N-acetylglucosamine-specific IIC component
MTLREQFTIYELIAVVCFLIALILWPHRGYTIGFALGGLGSFLFGRGLPMWIIGAWQRLTRRTEEDQA